jgi:RHS repeat-associated protein
MIVRHPLSLFCRLFFLALLITISHAGLADATVIKTITDYNVDGYGGNDIVTVSTESNKFVITVDSNKAGRLDVSYHQNGTINAENVYVENLDRRNGAEIIALYKDLSGKGKLLIINNSNKYYTSEAIDEQYTYSWPIVSANLNTTYNPDSPSLTQDLVILQLDGINGKEIIGVTDLSGNHALCIIRYGDNSSTGVTAYTYNPGGSVTDEFLINNLDGINGSEVVGFFSNSGKRSLYIVNHSLDNTGYTENYSKLEHFSFGKGILSSHIRVEGGLSRFTTSDVVISNLDSSNGKELVGLYKPTATTVGLFRISYRDSNFRVSSGMYTPIGGGVYLGLNNRLNDARYTIGNIDGNSLKDIYGYYGNPKLQGGFVYWDNLTRQNFYSSLALNGTFHSLRDNNVALSDVIYNLIDADHDGVNNTEDACPTQTGSIDSDGDGVCQPTDKCDGNPKLTTPGTCGCSTTDNDKDGWLDCVDACDSDPKKHITGICGCGVADVDSDGDGSYDCKDQCPADPRKTTPQICGCGNLEVSSDNNGNGVIDAGDCVPDACPKDPDKYVTGICGCGIPDLDSDGDGTYDCNDECAYDPAKTSRGVCGCFKSDLDGNGNGTIDCLEQDNSEEVYYYHNDPTGTPLAMTDVLANKVWEGEYLPFGEEYAAGGAIENNRQFIGKENDIETGLSYFGARYMDVGVGRFLAPDPIRIVDVAIGQVNHAVLCDPQRLNVYSYSMNNPLNWIDLWGLSPNYDLNGNGVKDFEEPAQEAVQGAVRKINLITNLATAVASEGMLQGVGSRASKGTERVRHFTNSKGVRGIESDGVIKASDQNSVFAVKARGKADSPRDVEKSLGIKRGRGNNYVEFDASPNEFNVVKNPQTGATERVFKGDVNLKDRNATFNRNR